MKYLVFIDCIDSKAIFALAKRMPYQQCLTHLWVLVAEYESSSLSKIAFFYAVPVFIWFGVLFCCGGYIWRYDSINELCPTWRFELIVALHTDPRSVWCVKSIYLNLFASIGIWQPASCFHLWSLCWTQTSRRALVFFPPLVSVSYSQYFALWILKWRKGDCIVCRTPNHCLVCAQTSSGTFLPFRRFVFTFLTLSADSGYKKHLRILFK